MQKTIVIGAAGTGKTCLLIENVIRLLEERGSGGKILILTSSPRAARDIGSRFKGALLDNRANNAGRMPALPVVIHTVRSLCAEVLKDSDPNLQILSDFRSWFILRESIRAGIVPVRSSYARVKDKHSFTREILELIESAPLDQLPIAGQTTDKLEDIKSIYGYYKGFCERHNLIPGFDVISRASSSLSKYSEQFCHIFIDQYENLRPDEIRAIESLCDHGNFTIFTDVVGRNSSLVNQIENVKKLDGVHGRLAANMAGHVNRLLGKAIYPETEGSNHQILTVAVEETAVDEAEYIARTIKKESSRPGRKYADFAILCREVSKHGRIIRDALKKYSIPCSGGLDISQDPMVQFVLLSLQVVAEPQEDDTVLKWLSSPVAGLDRADVYRAYAHAKGKRQGILRTVTEEATLNVNSTSFCKSSDRLKELLTILDFVRSELQSGRSIWELVSPILVRSGAISAGRMPALPNTVVLFIEMIRDIETTYEERRRMPLILDDIKAGLMQISDSEGAVYENGDADVVRIMSIHESRGLEFPFVFIPGMVSNFFPVRYPARQLFHGEDPGFIRTILRGIDLPGIVSSDRWREQEKQLFYIAMTRAKEKLYLTFAHNYPENEDSEPSPFLVDLLEGKEVSADNCAHYGILYQEHTVSTTPGKLPSLDDIISRSDLGIACCRYIRELELLDHQKSSEATKLLSNIVDDLIPPMPLKEIAITQLPSIPFNYTSIKNFLSCPRQYFLAHLLKLETDYGPGARFGKLVHEVLRIFHSQYRELCNHDLEKLWKDMRGILFDVWDGKMKAEDDTPGSYEEEFVHNRLQARSYLRLAEEVLQVYLPEEYNRWNAGRSCIFTERKFHFPFSNKYTLAGRTDRIDNCVPDGAEIIDFKTSMRDDESEYALKSKFLNMDDDPSYRPRDYQLPIYCLAGLNDRDLTLRKLVIYQLRNFKASGAPFRRELKILLDENKRSGKKDKFITKADLESVRGDISRTLDKMVSGFYPPEPYDDRTCEDCKFSFLCDREEEETGK